MLHNLYYDEYRLHERFIQKSPWRWGVVLQKDVDEAKAKDGESPDDEHPRSRRRGEPKMSNKEYRKMLAAETSRAKGRSYEDS